MQSCVPSPHDALQFPRLSIVTDCQLVYDLRDDGFHPVGFLLALALTLTLMVAVLGARQVNDRSGRPLPRSSRLFVAAWGGIFTALVGLGLACSYYGYRGALATLESGSAPHREGAVRDHRLVGHANDEQFSVGDVTVQLRGILEGYGMRDGSRVQDGQQVRLFYARPVTFTRSDPQIAIRFEACERGR